MNAHVLFCDDGFYAELLVDGVPVDECGPFDDRDDALAAGQRAIITAGGTPFELDMAIRGLHGHIE